MIKRLLIDGAAVLTVILALFIYHKNQPQFGTVDTGFIVAEQAKILAQMSPKTQFSPYKIRQLSDDLKDQVSDWGKRRNIILISKGAVWSKELRDYTKDLMEELSLEGRRP